MYIIQKFKERKSLQLRLQEVSDKLLNTERARVQAHFMGIRAEEQGLKGVEHIDGIITHMGKDIDSLSAEKKSLQEKLLWKNFFNK